VAIKIVASEKEHPLITTDPAERYLSSWTLFFSGISFLSVKNSCM
jgi:hypothetical protein